MFKKVTYLIVAVLALALSSCETEDALAVISQEEAIDKFITENFAENDVVRNNGSNRVIIQKGLPQNIVASGDSVTMLVNGYIFSNKPTNLFYSDSVTVKVSRLNMVEGLYDGLVGAELYEESIILFSAKYGFYKKRAGIIPSMSALMYNVLVTDIK